jgi:hypothetical protein
MIGTLHTEYSTFTIGRISPTESPKHLLATPVRFLYSYLPVLTQDLNNVITRWQTRDRFWRRK